MNDPRELILDAREQMMSGRLAIDARRWIAFCLGEVCAARDREIWGMRALKPVLEAILEGERACWEPGLGNPPSETCFEEMKAQRLLDMLSDLELAVAQRERELELERKRLGEIAQQL